MGLLLRHLLDCLILLPLLGAAVTWTMGRRVSPRLVAIICTSLVLAASITVTALYHPHQAQPPVYAYQDEGHPAGVVQIVERLPLMPSSHVEVILGVDGLSLPLLNVTALLCLLACIVPSPATRPDRRYYAMLLFLEVSLLGLFLSLDLVLFTLFFLLTILPAGVLIGSYGGQGGRTSAVKLAGYLGLGSLPVAIACAAMLHKSGNLDLVAMAAASHPAKGVGMLLFGLLVCGFFVRLPGVGVHAWLLDAVGEAPAALNMLFSLSTVAVGGYAIMRVAFPLFPEAAGVLSPLICTVGVSTALYAALCAMAQEDLKQLCAYQGIAAGGLVLLAIGAMTPACLYGASFMLVAQSLCGALLFSAARALSDRSLAGSLLSSFAADETPILRGVCMMSFLAGAGVPLFGGFVAIVLIVEGILENSRPLQAGQAMSIPPGRIVLAILACCAILLLSAAMVRAVQRLFFSTAKPREGATADLRPAEAVVLAALLLVALALGIFPVFFVLWQSRPTLDAMFRVAVGG